MVINLQEKMAELRSLSTASARAHRRKVVAKRRLTQIHTTKTPSGRRGFMSAPYKIKPKRVCKLCDNTPKKLSWHHWILTNPSVGIWVCTNCDYFAETVDSLGPGAVEKYTFLRSSLDQLYADGEIVKIAERADVRRLLHITVDGVQRVCLAWGKRNRPANNLCELCGVGKCNAYHHWDSEILGKGLWLCRRCHAFAERFDAYGEAFVTRYLSLKKKDELRVLRLMKRSNVAITSHMFPNLTGEHINTLLV